MRKRTRHTGATLIELIIALTILALLMTAVATAMHASLMSYVENEKIATVVQTTRSLLNRITTQVRTALSVAATGSSLTIIPPDDGSGITEIHYEYTDGKLLYRQTKSGTPTTYVLIDDPDVTGTENVKITAFSIIEQRGPDSNGVDCVKSITLRIELVVDNETFAVTSTAAPRRNQLY